MAEGDQLAGNGIVKWIVRHFVRESGSVLGWLRCDTLVAAHLDLMKLYY